MITVLAATAKSGGDSEKEAQPGVLVPGVGIVNNPYPNLLRRMERAVAPASALPAAAPPASTVPTPPPSSAAPAPVVTAAPPAAPPVVAAGPPAGLFLDEVVARLHGDPAFAAEFNQRLKDRAAAEAAREAERKAADATGKPKLSMNVEAGVASAPAASPDLASVFEQLAARLPGLSTRNEGDASAEEPLDGTLEALELALGAFGVPVTLLDELVAGFTGYPGSAPSPAVEAISAPSPSPVQGAPPTLAGQQAVGAATTFVKAIAARNAAHTPAATTAAPFSSQRPLDIERLLRAAFAQWDAPKREPSDAGAPNGTPDPNVATDPFMEVFAVAGVEPALFTEAFHVALEDARRELAASPPERARAFDELLTMAAAGAHLVPGGADALDRYVARRKHDAEARRWRNRVRKLVRKARDAPQRVRVHVLRRGVARRAPRRQAHHRVCAPSRAGPQEAPPPPSDDTPSSARSLRGPACIRGTYSAIVSRYRLASPFARACGRRRP